jgi:hypothetical protein
MSKRFSAVRLVVCSSLMLAFPAATLASSITFSAGGNNTTASIQATVDGFRTAIGGVNNMNNPGPLASGRREINWDGGGAVPTASGTPFAGFQNNRGVLLTTSGTGFLQAQPADLGDPSYATLFSAFSPLRLFTPVGSNVTDVTFFVPGTTGSATVSAFGAIFSDVDLANTTRLDFFDQNNLSLGSFFAPPGTTANQSFSFLGVLFDAGERIGRVRITTGTGALIGQEMGGNDFVVMDDFILAEPAAIPEPATLILVGAGLFAVRAAQRRRT